MSTSSTSELLALADSIEECQSLTTIERVYDRKFASDPHWEEPRELTDDERSSIVSALRLAATPKAGVDREVIAREICLSYGRDPDEPTSPLEMCTADNQPVPTWEVYNEQAEWLLERYTILALPSVLGGVDQPSSADGPQCNEQSGKQLSPAWRDVADALAALQLPEAEIQRSLADELEAAANWMQLYLDTYGELGDDATQASIDDWHDAVKHARKSGGFCS